MALEVQTSFGHKWSSGQLAMEHICTEDWCWRCWETKTVHLWGPWPHTLYFNSVERRLAAIILIVWFVLFLTWPGSRD